MGYGGDFLPAAPAMIHPVLPDCIEITTAPNPTCAVVFLHGLGADGNDFAPVVPQLLRPGWPPVRFVFPHAPVRPITVNGGMRMRAWYDIAGVDIAARQDEAGVRQSIGLADALIAREGERGVPPSRVVLAGFSQGGAIALAAGVRRAQPLAGIVALSTYLPIAESSIAQSTRTARSTPVFMAHGAFDPIVPQALGERSRDALRALGMKIDWHSYPMAHQVCPPEIMALATWLGARWPAA